MAPLGHLHLAILLALSTGPIALVTLGRRLPACRSFAREFSDLVMRGWIRPAGAFCHYELTEPGRAAVNSFRTSGRR